MDWFAVDSNQSYKFSLIIFILIELHLLERKKENNLFTINIYKTFKIN